MLGCILVPVFANFFVAMALLPVELITVRHPVCLSIPDVPLVFPIPVRRLIAGISCGCFLCGLAPTQGPD